MHCLITNVARSTNKFLLSETCFPSAIKNRRNFVKNVMYGNGYQRTNTIHRVGQE